MLGTDVIIQNTSDVLRGQSVEFLVLLQVVSIVTTYGLERVVSRNIIAVGLCVCGKYHVIISTRPSLMLAPACRKSK